MGPPQDLHDSKVIGFTMQNGWRPHGGPASTGPPWLQNCWLYYADRIEAPWKPDFHGSCKEVVLHEALVSGIKWRLAQTLPKECWKEFLPEYTSH